MPSLKGLGMSFGSILARICDAFGTLCAVFGTLWESIGSFTKPSVAVGRWVSLGLRVLSLHFLNPFSYSVFSRCSSNHDLYSAGWTNLYSICFADLGPGLLVSRVSGG